MRADKELTSARRIGLLVKILNDRRVSLRTKGVAAMILLLPYEKVCNIQQIQRYTSDRFTPIRNALAQLKKFMFIHNKKVHVDVKNTDKITLMYTVIYYAKKYVISPLTNGGGYKK